MLALGALMLEETNQVTSCRALSLARGGDGGDDDMHWSACQQAGLC